MKHKIGDVVIVKLNADEADLYLLTLKYMGDLWRACPVNRQGIPIMSKAVVLREDQMEAIPPS